MKRYYLLLFCLCLLAATPLLAQKKKRKDKRLKKFTYEIKTLTNGKYDEIFHDDTLMQVGLGIINTVTGELVETLEEDTTYGGHTYYYEVPIRWLSIDPLAEKFPSYSGYNFVENDPIRKMDPDGLAPLDVYYSPEGEYLGRDNKTSDEIRIIDKGTWNILNRNSKRRGFRDPLSTANLATERALTEKSVGIRDAGLSPQAISNVYTDILDKMSDVDVSKLHNSMVSVSNNTSIIRNGKRVFLGFNDPASASGVANTDRRAGTASWLKEGQGYTGSGTGFIKVTVVSKLGGLVPVDLTTESGVQNTLGVHEFIGHGEKGYGFNDKSRLDPNGTHYKAYELQMNHPSWQRTSPDFKKDILENYELYQNQKK